MTITDNLVGILIVGFALILGGVMFSLLVAEKAQRSAEYANAHFIEDKFKSDLNSFLLTENPATRWPYGGLVASAAYFVVWFYQPIMANLGIPILYFGLVHAGLLLAEILVSSHFHVLEKVLGSGKAYLRSSALLVSLVFFLVAIFPHPVTLTLLIIIGGGIGYTRTTYIASLANKYIDSAHRATTLSSIGMVRRLALVVLNPVIGYAATRSFPLALLLVGLFPLASLFIKEEV